ncbi:TadE/TadG family type IV pilus assembly protein [Erythrobacter sp. GH1-10]|uniref:TadE/TadG family type IV pilus assembly protein n=1 Tax=Erythrobacter sp. GH1-10 TaxID=3349334 RepID=UPI003877ABD0
MISRIKKCSSGNALILVAIGMPVLVGGAGFAVDTAQWYMWKRELQHAVDQAAIAGAWARADVGTESTYATRALQEYDANVAKVEEFDTPPQVSLADYAGGSQNSVVVTATASKELPFSSFIMGRAATVRATAQASYREGATYNACLISLRESGSGTTIGGNATVRANCGLAALSCDENAIVIDGSATVQTESIAACGTIDAEGLEYLSTEGVQGLEDSYAELEPPTNDTARDYKCQGSGKNRQASLQPGTYTSMVVKCTTQLQSGIYVIDGGTLDLSANYDVTGNRVMFVLKNGATVKLGGQGNDNSLNLTPMQSADFFGTPYESKADDYADILIFEDRNNDPGQDHIFNGNSNSLIEGLIYLPDGNLQVNGTADVAAQCLKISAYTIDVRGGAFLETLCPIDESTEVGTSLADVRLVA